MLRLIRVSLQSAGRYLSTNTSEFEKVLGKWPGGKVRFEEKNEGKLVEIILDRTDKSNAFSGTMLQEFKQATQKLKTLDNAGIVVLRGEGGNFCSGADLTMIEELTQSNEIGLEMHDFVSSALHSIRDAPPLSIAIIKGNCLGGGTELSSACDLRLAHKSAKFGFWQARLGIVPVWGGASYLVQIVGRATALKLMTSAPLLTADEAFQAGYVDKLFDTDDEAQDFIKSILKHNAHVIRNQKAMVNAVSKGRDGEIEIVRKVWSSPAHKTAFKKQLDAVVKKK